MKSIIKTQVLRNLGLVIKLKLSLKIKNILMLLLAIANQKSIAFLRDLIILAVLLEKQKVANNNL